MPIQELYRTIRNQIRRLAHRDSLYLVWAYSQYLQHPNFLIPNDIEVAPQFLKADFRQAIIAEWTLEKLACEIIRHADEEAKQSRSLRQWATLAQIANGIRQLEGDIYVQLVV